MSIYTRKRERQGGGRERERKREKDREKDGEKDRERDLGGGKTNFTFMRFFCLKKASAFSRCFVTIFIGTFISSVMTEFG
jgi:hypothetical protein